MSRAKLWTYNGISKTLDEWADDIGMTASALRHRLKLGWDFGKAVTTPHRSYKKKSIQPKKCDFDCFGCTDKSCY